MCGCVGNIIENKYIRKTRYHCDTRKQTMRELLRTLRELTPEPGWVTERNLALPHFLPAHARYVHIQHVYVIKLNLINLGATVHYA